MSDADLLHAFETCTLPLAGFRHREHLRLAYIYLTIHRFEDAKASFKRHVRKFLSRAGVPNSYYHETMTHAWLLMVRHHMRETGPTASSEAFLAECPSLLDQRSLLKHYTQERLDLPVGRTLYLDPDLEPIPSCA